MSWKCEHATLQMLPGFHARAILPQEGFLGAPPNQHLYELVWKEERPREDHLLLQLAVPHSDACRYQGDRPGCSMETA